MDLIRSPCDPVVISHGLPPVSFLPFPPGGLFYLACVYTIFQVYTTICVTLFEGYPMKASKPSTQYSTNPKMGLPMPCEMCAMDGYADGGLVQPEVLTIEEERRKRRKDQYEGDSEDVKFGKIF